MSLKVMFITIIFFSWVIYDDILTFIVTTDDLSQLPLICRIVIRPIDRYKKI